jgi:hypothetical protein
MRARAGPFAWGNGIDDSDEEVTNESMRSRERCERRCLGKLVVQVALVARLRLVSGYQTVMKHWTPRRPTFRQSSPKWTRGSRARGGKLCRASAGIQSLVSSVLLKVG